MIEVLPVGTAVKLDNIINAVIIGVIVRKDDVVYQCGWWQKNETYLTGNFYDFEFTVCPATQKTTIGFKNDNS